MRVEQEKVVRLATNNDTPIDVNIFDAGAVTSGWGGNAVYSFHADIVAYCNGDATIDAWILSAKLWRPVAGSVVIIGSSVSSELTCKEDAAWDATIIVTDPDIQVQVTGDALDDVEWTIWATIFAGMMEY